MAYDQEASKYDVEYVKKYSEDLDTTLIFVRRLTRALVDDLTSSFRRVCSLPLARLS